MLKPADPRYRSLNPDAETRMRDRAIPAQIQIPGIDILRQIVLAEAALKKGRVVNALAAADDLAVTFGSEQVG